MIVFRGPTATPTVSLKVNHVLCLHLVLNFNPLLLLLVLENTMFLEFFANLVNFGKSRGSHPNKLVEETKSHQKNTNTSFKVIDAGEENVDDLHVGFYGQFKS